MDAMEILASNIDVHNFICEHVRVNRVGFFGRRRLKRMINSMHYSFQSACVKEILKYKFNGGMRGGKSMAINDKPENLKCPDCDGPMLVRTNRQSGEKFWGCKKFPDCKGTRDSMGMSKADRDLEREDQAQNEDNPKSSFNRVAENDQFRFKKS